MKTTVQIADSLLEEARKLARREGTTLKALIQEGLRKVVAEHSHKREFRLRDVSFGGTGLQPAMADAAWDRIREMIYEGRGG